MERITLVVRGERADRMREELGLVNKAIGDAVRAANSGVCVSPNFVYGLWPNILTDCIKF